MYISLRFWRVGDWGVGTWGATTIKFTHLPNIRGWNSCRCQQTRSYTIVRKLPGGNCQRNRLSLNWCSPYTEIFSKRRKIYTVCVESLSREWICCGNSIMTWELSGPLELMKLFNLLWCIQRSLIFFLSFIWLSDLYAGIAATRCLAQPCRSLD